MFKSKTSSPPKQKRSKTAEATETASAPSSTPVEEVVQVPSEPVEPPKPAEKQGESIELLSSANKEGQKLEVAPPTPSTQNVPAVTPQKAPEKKKGLGLFQKKEKKVKVVKPQSSSGFTKALASLNNIGLGKEKAHFVENLAILLNSGLSVVDALKTIHMEIRLKPMKKLVSRIIDQVESGMPLWMSMDDQNFFSMYALALIRIGEESGALSRNMEYLSVQQEKDRALRGKVKMAMIYPSIVIVLTAIITLGLAWFVLPQLVGVLLALDAKLPLVTLIIIWVSNFFRDHGAVAVPSIFGLMLGTVLLCKYTRLKGPSQQFIFRIPGIGTMARSATIARFGVILGSLLKAGVPLVESIKSMAEVTDIVSYREFYFRLGKEIEVGQSFAAAFESLKEAKHLLPASVQQLVITGEKSGKMSDMLLRIADIYEKKAEGAAERLPVVLEPMLLLFIGGLVGTIAFAIIVPIYSIVGSVGR
ncbi:MAG: type II secretion system F family protein [Candidatus Peribacteraceae bacterium]